MLFESVTPEGTKRGFSFLNQAVHASSDDWRFSGCLTSLVGIYRKNSLQTIHKCLQIIDADSEGDMFTTVFVVKELTFTTTH